MASQLPAMHAVHGMTLYLLGLVVGLRPGWGGAVLGASWAPAGHF